MQERTVGEQASVGAEFCALAAVVVLCVEKAPARLGRRGEGERVAAACTTALIREIGIARSSHGRGCWERRERETLSSRAS